MSGPSKRVTPPKGEDKTERDEFDRILEELEASEPSPEPAVADSRAVPPPERQELPPEGGEPGTMPAAEKPEVEPFVIPEEGPTVELIKEPARKLSKRVTKKQLLERLSERNKQIFEYAKRLQAREEEKKTLLDRLMRTQAEFENFRKRSRKEWDLLRKTATQELILELLPVLDNFERAQAQSAEEPGNLIEGYNLVYTGLLETMAKHGLRPIEAEGRPFDPHLHEAFQEIEVEGVPSHQVIEVVLRGYYLGDKVLRPAKVIVAK